MDKIKWWQLALSMAGAVAVTIIFLFGLINHHETTAHSPLYSPRYQGDSVSRRIAEVETAADVALKDEVRDWEKRFGRVMDKLDNISEDLGEVKSDVKVLKARQE